MAMMVIAMRSSTTARVSRNERSAEGRDEPMTASTARAKAMSVAVGIAHPRRASPSAPPGHGGEEDQSGHDDPADGRHHRHHGLGRRRRSPTRNSRLSSSPATKKKMASRPSPAQCPTVRSRWPHSMPTTVSRTVK